MIMSTTDQDIGEFLKAYGEQLRECADWSWLPATDFPLATRTRMAYGIVQITTRDGRNVATVSVDGGGTTPSMPVSGADIAYSNMLATLANRWNEWRQAKQRGPAELLIDTMRSNWSRIGIDIPTTEDGSFCEQDAIEVALNELRDYAVDHGLRVEYQDAEVGSVGLKVVANPEASKATTTPTDAT
jgi:hypothetical protein